MREERNSEREREVTQQTRDAAELADLKERLLRLQEENRKLQSKVGAYTMHNLVKGFNKVFALQLSCISVRFHFKSFLL